MQKFLLHDYNHIRFLNVFDRKYVNQDEEFAMVCKK